jgi:nitrite reductase/ring-hydroxylating ferredoxin subunit
MELIRIARLSELQELGPLCLQHRGVPYCVVKVQGTVRAFIALCAHEDRSFSPRIQEGCLVCPFHHVTFTMSSGEVQESRGKHVPHGLLPVETTVRDGVVYLQWQHTHCTFVAESDARRQKRAADRRARSWFGFFRVHNK